MTEESAFTRKFRKELMAGLSSLVLLAVLARAGREMYGYEIAKAVKAEGEGGLIFKQGAIYPVLRSLNSLGLLESRVEASAFGPPRRIHGHDHFGSRPGSGCPHQLPSAPPGSSCRYTSPLPSGSAKKNIGG